MSDNFKQVSVIQSVVKDKLKNHRRILEFLKKSCKWENIFHIPYKRVGGECGFNCWGVQVARARVILVLREFIWNAPAVSLGLSAFDDTGSLGFPPP